MHRSVARQAGRIVARHDSAVGTAADARHGEAAGRFDRAAGAGVRGAASLLRGLLGAPRPTSRGKRADAVAVRCRRWLRGRPAAPALDYDGQIAAAPRSGNAGSWRVSAGGEDMGRR